MHVQTVKTTLRLADSRLWLQLSGLKLLCWARADEPQESLRKHKSVYLVSGLSETWAGMGVVGAWLM